MYNGIEPDFGGMIGGFTGMALFLNLLSFKFVRGKTSGLLKFFIDFKPLAFSLVLADTILSTYSILPSITIAYNLIST